MKRVGLIFALSLPLVGCSPAVEKNSHTVASLRALSASDVTSVRVWDVGAQKQFSANTQVGKQVVQDLVDWLHSAEFVGQETNVVPPKAGVVDLSIQTSRGVVYEIQSAYNCTRNGNFTACVPARGELDLQVAGEAVTTRVKSAPLYKWFQSGWQNDAEPYPPKSQ